MALNDIKLDRTLKAFGDRLPKKNASNQSGGTLDGSTVTVEYDLDEDGNYTNARVLDEGKKHHTPKFVQHCVTAITEKPEKLADVEAGGPGGEKGSPFAICNAAYKKKTRSKAASHAKGKHHSVKQYKQSLATLRESLELVRKQNPLRHAMLFENTDYEPKQGARRYVRYAPRG